jgi:hypothetical protein
VPSATKKTPTSFDAALFPHEHKTYTELQMSKQNEKREKKMHTVSAAGLKTASSTP